VINRITPGTLTIAVVSSINKFNEIIANDFRSWTPWTGSTLPETLPPHKPVGSTLP
jgi:hypothetical protein